MIAWKLGSESEKVVTINKKSVKINKEVIFEMRNKKKIVVAFSAYVILYEVMRKRYRNMRKRRWYARPLNDERATQNYFTKYFCKMKAMDPEQFVLHTRMSSTLYDMLLASIKVHIIKPKQMINADERLSITLL